MHLNEIDQTHEHASTSLKILLLVFTLVLIGALSYLVWQYNTQPDDTDYSAPKVTTAQTAEDNSVACGEKEYAFELTFGNLWTGHKVKEVKPSEAVIYCYFNMPTADATWAAESSTNFAGFVSLFAVGVYTPAQWTTAQEEANKPAELGHNDSYYWGWTPAQSYPDALKPVSDDVKNVVKTFKIAK